MPARNTLKQYMCNTYYHLYNRGVEKRQIFQDERDYKVFLSYLRTYLLPPQPFLVPGMGVFPSKQLKNYAQEIDLLAYCLMPNHFHLLIYQRRSESINFFMRSLLTKYVKYFNRCNHREGPLFQSRYKAVVVESLDHLLYVSKYIHLNPMKVDWTAKTVFAVSSYSSFENYLNLRNQSWLKPRVVLDYFAQQNKDMTASYKDYVMSDFEDCLRSFNSVF